MLLTESLKGTVSKKSIAYMLLENEFANCFCEVEINKVKSIFSTQSLYSPGKVGLENETCRLLLQYQQNVW